MFDDFVEKKEKIWQKKLKIVCANTRIRIEYNKMWIKAYDGAI